MMGANQTNKAMGAYELLVYIHNTVIPNITFRPSINHIPVTFNASNALRDKFTPYRNTGGSWCHNRQCPGDDNALHAYLKWFFAKHKRNVQITVIERENEEIETIENIASNFNSFLEEQDNTLDKSSWWWVQGSSNDQRSYANLVISFQKNKPYKYNFCGCANYVLPFNDPNKLIVPRPQSTIFHKHSNYMYGGSNNQITSQPSANRKSVSKPHYNYYSHYLNSDNSNNRNNHNVPQGNNHNIPQADTGVPLLEPIPIPIPTKYKCHYCIKQFASVGDLNRHIRTHTGETPYKCLHCNKSFKQKGNLTRHVRTHTGETPFVCKYCDREFSAKNNLTVHLRTHTGEKPFECNVCRKKFTQSPHCKNHMKHMHPTT